MSSGSLAGAQLDALLTGDWLTRGPLLLSEDLTPRELESSLALENARRFLATLLEAGALPATSDGALAHEALDRLLDILRWGAPDYGARVRAEFRADLREGDVQPVRIMRLVLTRLGGRAARAPGFRVVPGPLELLLRRFLEILPDYCLLESAPSLGKSTVAYPRYRKTPLFDRFIRFDFGVDPTPHLEVSPLGSLRLLR